MSSEPDLEAHPGDDGQESVTKSFSFVRNHKTLTLTLVVAVATGAVFVTKVSVADEASEKQLDDVTQGGELLSLVLSAVTAFVEKYQGRNEQVSSPGAEQATMVAFQQPAENVDGDTVQQGETYWEYFSRLLHTGE